MKSNSTKSDIQTAKHKELIAAIENKDNVKVKILTAEITPEELSYNDSIDGTALHVAIGSRNHKAVKLLIKKMLPEAFSARQRDQGSTALMKAAYYEMNETVKLLLDLVNSEDISAVDFLNKNVLHYGVDTLTIEVLKLILEKMPRTNLSVVSKYGTPLHIAVFIQAIHPHQPCAYELMKLLLDKMPISEIDKLNLEGKTPLGLAIQYDKIEITDLLIAKGASISLAEKVNFSDCGILIQGCLSDGLIADKVYNGESVDPVKIIMDKGLFFSRLRSKIAAYGMPEGCINIREYLEVYKLGLPTKSINHFIEHLPWGHIAKLDREKVIKVTHVFDDQDVSADINAESNNAAFEEKPSETVVTGAQGLSLTLEID